MGQKKNRDIHPLIIHHNRYGKNYGGDKFIAFNLDIDNFPEEIHGSKSEQKAFWKSIEKEGKYLVGKGSTPQEAFNELYEKIKKGK